MEKKNSNSFIVQGVILAMASIAVRFIGILYRIPLQNILGDEGMGYYSTAYEIYSILLIVSSYSLPTAISKLVSTRVAKKEFKNAYKVFIGGVVFASIVGAVAAIFTFLASDFLANVFKFPESAMALRALTPTLFIVAIMGVFRGFFQGFGTMIPTAISQIIEKLVQVALSLILCYNIMKNMTAASIKDPSIVPEAYGAYGATLGNAFGAIFALAFLVFVLFAFKGVLSKKIRRTSFKPEEDYGTIFKLLILTIIPVLLSTTVNNISSIIDNFIVGNMLNFKGFDKKTIASLWGILSNKYRTFISLPISVASAMAVSTMPSMSAAIAVGNRKASLSKIGMSIRFICVFSIPCAVGIMILANPLLQLLYYDGATHNAVGTYLLWIGAVTIILTSLTSITNAILQGMGHLRLPVIHCAIGLGAHIVAALLLMGVFNLSVYAIVIADIVMAVTTLVLNYYYIYKHYNYRQEIKKTFLIPLAAAAIMGVVTSGSYHLLALITHSRALLLLIPVILAVITYVLCMILFKGITADELEDMPKGAFLLKIFKKLHLM